MQLGSRWLLVLVLALAGCQAAPPPPRTAAKNPGALAAEALQQGDAAKAADLYRSALVAEPTSVPLHYGLGLAASYLDRKTEAVREFTWVIERGDKNSAEAKAAREWLVAVGALSRSTAAALPSDDSPAPERASANQEAKQAPASVQGRALFDDTPGLVVPMERIQLLLSDYPNRIVYLRLRTDERGYFHFKDVPPGIYKLTDRVAGPPRWRLRVELKPGQDLTLDLSPSNSTRARDDFPDAAQAVGSPSS
jgi:hypothetical protein